MDGTEHGGLGHDRSLLFQRRLVYFLASIPLILFLLELIAKPRQIFDSLWKITPEFLSFFIGTEQLSSMKIVVLLLVFLATGIGMILLFRYGGRSRCRRILNFSVLAQVGTLCWASYYVFCLGSLRPLHFACLSIGAYLVVLPCAFTTIFHFIPNSKLRTIAGVILVIAVVVLSRPTAPFSPQEYDKYRSVLAANPLLPNHPAPSLNVGSFNPGVFNYFMTEDVIDLDGTVTPEVVETLRNGSLPAYIRKKNIGCLIEQENAARLNLISDDKRFVLTKWVDLADCYSGYTGDVLKINVPVEGFRQG